MVLIGFGDITTLEEPIGRVEVEVRVGKLENGKAVGKDYITGEMIKGGCEKVVDWIWRLCNKGFESGVVPKDWRSALIVPLYKGKGEISECKNYKGINLLNVVGKINAVILMHRDYRLTGGLNEDQQCGFRAGMGCVDQIFTPKQIMWVL